MTADRAPPTAETLLAHTEWVRALARSLVVDPGTADDVAQDAALVAWTKPPSDERAVRGWLRRVVTNLAHNARRGETRRGAREAAVAAPEGVESADEVVARWEIRRRVVEAVLALDEPYRTTILLRFFDGLAVTETAERLGVPLETVRTRTRRGLELLRGRLAALDDGEGRRGVAVLLFLARDDGPGTGGAVTGGAVMASSTKWALSAAAALLLGLGVTWTLTAGQPDDPPPAKRPAETATSPKPRHAERPAEEAKPAGVDPAAGDGELDLFGVVLDPDGKPVAETVVTALRKAPWSETLATRDSSKMLVAAESVKSTESGAFALRLARDDGVSLRVDAAGFALWESEYRQAGERVVVRLAPALTLDVRVLSSDGAPVAGAPVRVGVSPADGERVLRWGRTGADGRARFERMPRGGKGDVSVSAQSLSLAYRAAQFADSAEQTIDVRLPAKRTVHGVVIDASTKVGLAGADVRPAGGFGDAVVTDSLGRFEIAAYPSTSIEAMAEGRVRGEATPVEKRDATIALAGAARLVGRVVDERGGPVKDADVAAIGNPDRGSEGVASVGGARSDADGAFRIDGLIPGRSHLLRVRAAGHAVLVKPVYTTTDAPYELRLRDVVLAASHALRGRVVGADDKPAVRTYVHVAGPDGRGDFVINDHRLTDDLGRFAFPELAPGTYVLEVRAVGRRDPTEAVVPVVGDAPPVVIRLDEEKPSAKRTVPFPVRVLDDEGRPVAGVGVQVGYAANGAPPSKKTGDDGSVTIDLEYAPANVWVTGFDRAKWIEEWTPLRPGATEAVVVLRHGVAISGRVVGEEGEGLSSAAVEAFDGARHVGFGQTDADGRFAFAVPAARKLDLLATSQSGLRDAKYRERSAGELWGVESGTTDLVVRMTADPAMRTLDVEVVDEAGAPIVGARVQAMFPGSDRRMPKMGETAADGHARAGDWSKPPSAKDDDRVGVEGVPRVPMTLSVTMIDRPAGPNRYWSPVPRRIPGDLDAVKIVVGKPRRLHGRVRREDGSPCGGAIVSVNPGSGQMSMNVAEDDGRFAIDVPADMPSPFSVNGQVFPENGKPSGLMGWDVADAADRELEIVVRPAPKR